MKKRISIYLCLSSFGLFSVIALALTPIYSILMSNTIYSESVLTVVLDLLIDVLSVIAYALSYAFVIYGAYKFTVRKTKGMLFIFGGALMYFFVLTALNSYFFESMYFAPEIGVYVLNIFLSMLIQSVMVLVLLLILNGCKDMKKTAIWASIIFAVFNILDRVIYDFQIGFPQSASEVWQMVFYYTSDVLMGLVMCVTMLFAFISLKKAETKKAV